MTVRKEDFDRSTFIFEKDSNNGKTKKIILPADSQIGTPSVPCGLQLFGRLAVNDQNIFITASNKNKFQILSEKTVVGVSVTTVVPDGNRVTLTLPHDPKEGQLHFVKDFTGTSATYPIDVYPSGTSLIDDQTIKTISGAYGVMGFVWIDSQWRVLVDASGGTAAAAAGGGGIVPGDPSGVWALAYEVDFTSLSLSTAVANGNFTIDGLTWTVQNFANSSVMSVGGADGLRIRAATTSSTMSTPSRTAPIFKSPSLSTILNGLAPDDIRIGVRISCAVLSSNRTVTNDSTFMTCDTGDNLQRSEFSTYRTGGAVQMNYMRLVLNSVTLTSTNVGANLTSHNCYQMEIPFLGTDITLLQSGIYSSGFPSKWHRRALNASAAGAWANIQMTELANCYVCLGIEAGNAAGTSESKWNRFRVEYKYETDTA